MKKYSLVLIFSIASFTALCQWNSNTMVNNIVANSNINEYAAIAVTDGSNGSIIFCEDYNSGGNIYAQKILSNGSVAWGTTGNPVQICVTPQDKYDRYAIADGNGGAYITWSDYRFNNDAGEIFIQRINGAGVPQWGANGLRVTNNVPRDDLEPLLCSDGAGGIIVVWYGDDTTNKNIQSYAQRYNSAGLAQWTVNGIQVCTAAGFRGANAVVSDGNNGAIIFFLDTRNDPNGLDYDYLNDNDITNADIYAQRLNGNGNRLWTNNGLPVITAQGNQQGIGKAVTDGNGGAIFVFDDERNDDGTFSNYDIYAQKVNSSGATQWTANGVALSTADGNQNLATVVPDGSGGVVAAFKFEDAQLYTQRINTAGAASWIANGIAISQPADNVTGVSIENDGSGNVILAYQVNKSGFNIISAQKLNAAGAIQWPADGAIVCNAGSPYNPCTTLSDNGSIIIAWDNALSGTSQEDTYASKLLANGVLAANSVATYVSAANGNWNSAASWVGGVVPPQGASVIIHHLITCNVNASCASLKIEQAGANLIVLTGFNITITK